MRYISADIGGFKAFGAAMDIIKAFKESGFTAYDASMCDGALDDILFAENWEEKAKELRAYADGLGIVCNQSHAPFASARKGDEEYNRQMFPKLVRAIQVSGILGVKVCVVHPCNDWTAEENAEYIYKPLEPYARAAGVKIGVENMWNGEWRENGFTALPAACSHHGDFKKHLDLLPADIFVACLDIGHAEMRGLDTSAVQMIETLAERLEALHIHDVDKTFDNHQIPFTHNIDFEAVIQALKKAEYKGDITLEACAFSEKAPKGIQRAAIQYSAAVAEYFRARLDD